MQHQLYQPDPHLVLIAAHRGLWRDAPENSETALRLSFANWEIIETDLVKTKDYQSINQLVVTHDPEISRTMDGMGRLYNLTLAQLQQCRLLDHYGSVYTGGVWYPSDNKGTPANDAVTGVGQRVITIDDLFRMQQDFLIGTDVKPLGPIIIMDVKGARGQELDPEFKTPGEGIMNTMNLALRTMSKLSLQQRKSMIFMVRYGLLKNNKEGLSARAYLEQYVPEYQNYDANTNPLPRLMPIFNYEDPKDDPPTSATPTNDAHFQSLLTGPYLSHFEMNEFYLGDGCQAYIDYLAAQGNYNGISTYSENAFFPEGVWDINRFAMRNTDFSSTTTRADLRQFPEFTLANKGVGLITTERPDEANAILTQYGLRNVPMG